MLELKQIEYIGPGRVTGKISYVRRGHTVYFTADGAHSSIIQADLMVQTICDAEKIRKWGYHPFFVIHTARGYKMSRDPDHLEVERIRGIVPRHPFKWTQVPLRKVPPEVFEAFGGLLPKQLKEEDTS